MASKQYLTAEREAVIGQGQKMLAIRAASPPTAPPMALISESSGLVANTAASPAWLFQATTPSMGDPSASMGSGVVMVVLPWAQPQLPHKQAMQQLEQVLVQLYQQIDSMMIERIPGLVKRHWQYPNALLQTCES